MPLPLPAELHLRLVQDSVDDLRRQLLAFGNGEDAVTLGAARLLRVHVAPLGGHERPLGREANAEVAGRLVGGADHEEGKGRMVGLLRLLRLELLRFLWLGRVRVRGVEEVGVAARVVRAGYASLCLHRHSQGVRTLLGRRRQRQAKPGGK